MCDLTYLYTTCSGPFALHPDLPDCPRHPLGRTPGARSPPGPGQGMPDRFGTRLKDFLSRSACPMSIFLYCLAMMVFSEF